MALRPWLERFRDEVVTIDERVSREVEVTKHLVKHPRQPVHFRDLDGFEACGNLWSTRTRVAASLGTTPTDLMFHILEATDRPVDVDLVDSAPFMRNQSDDVDLLDSPVPKLYPGDAGRYITAGVWSAEWKGVRNLSFHRILLLDRRTGACRIVPRHLRHMWQESTTAGEELPVAVGVGLNPWLLIGGGTSVGYGVDEMRIASALKERCLGSRVEAVKLRSGLVVPADAEYVLEGRLTARTHAEGPFVDAVGTYDRVRDEPVLEVDRVYHRDDPVFHIIVGGLDEHFMFMGMPREPVLYRAVSKAVPQVHAVRLTEGGCAWLHGVISITKHHAGDGKNAIMAAFGAHTSMKQVTIVDEDIDVYDDREVEWAVATRFQADHGLVVLHGVRGSSIDPSADDGVTAKMGIDATLPEGAEQERFAKATLP